MEGPCIREFPRTLLDSPVELRVGDRSIAIEKAAGNLSVGGLFVKAKSLPSETPVRIRIAAPLLFEADGVVRYSGGNGRDGVGIKFTLINQTNRKRLDDLIGELTRKGAPAC